MLSLFFNSNKKFLRSSYLIFHSIQFHDFHFHFSFFHRRKNYHLLGTWGLVLIHRWRTNRIVSTIIILRYLRNSSERENHSCSEICLFFNFKFLSLNGFSQSVDYQQSTQSTWLLSIRSFFPLSSSNYELHWIERGWKWIPRGLESMKLNLKG
jgi:hypothetical protein